jgi:hypothetical protein
VGGCLQYGGVHISLAQPFLSPVGHSVKILDSTRRLSVHQLHKVGVSDTMVVHLTVLINEGSPNDFIGAMDTRGEKDWGNL